MKSFGIWVLVVAAVVIAGIFLLQPISHVKDTPLIRAYSQLHQTCGKLRHYADEHSTFPGGGPTNGSIDTLVSAGILSPDKLVLSRQTRAQGSASKPLKFPSNNFRLYRRGGGAYDG